MSIRAVIDPKFGIETLRFVRRGQLTAQEAIRSEVLRLAALPRQREVNDEELSGFRLTEGEPIEISYLPPHIKLLLKKHDLAVTSVGGGSIALPVNGQVIKLRLKEPQNLNEFVSNLVQAAKLQAGNKNSLSVFTAGIPGFPWEENGKKYFVLPPNSFPLVHTELTESEFERYNDKNLYLIELEKMVQEAAQEEGLTIGRVVFYNDMANVSIMQPLQGDLYKFLKSGALGHAIPRRVRCGGTGTGDICGEKGSVHELSHVSMDPALKFLPQEIQDIINEHSFQGLEAEFFSSGGKTDEPTNLSKLATLLAQQKGIISNDQQLNTKELLSLVLHGEQQKLDEGFQTLFRSARTTVNGIHTALFEKRDKAREVLNILAQSLGVAYARMDTALNSEVLVPNSSKESTEMVVGPGVNILRHGGFLNVFYDGRLGDELLEVANQAYKSTLRDILQERGVSQENINAMLKKAAIVRGQRPTGGPDIGTLPLLALSLKS